VSSIEIPEAFSGLFEPHRYKVYYGGRGSGKSWAAARALVNLAHHTPLRVVCAREFQNSIQESVHQLLSDQIKLFGLPFTIQDNCIFNDIGSEFIFKGLSKQEGATVKSLEGADIVWVEEAQNVSEASWRNLTPTVRKDGSEIWVTFNPDVEDAPTYQRFVIKQPTNALVRRVNWDENPWFPAVLEQERLDMLRDDPVGYQNVWEGHPRTFAEGAYWREEFEALERAGRIGDVPYDPNRPVFTWWDLTHSKSESGDPSVVFFIQATATGTFDCIDYWEGNNVSLGTVAKDVILARPYTYGKHFLPHDGKNTNSHTGKSDEDFLKGHLGPNVETIERTKDVERDLNNVRLILPKCRFDAVKCKAGLAALRNHRRAKNEKTGLWGYVHDWTSHGAAAFRGFAIDHHRMNTLALPPRTRRNRGAYSR
jgi:phage terminase large subunit